MMSKGHWIARLSLNACLPRRAQRFRGTPTHPTPNTQHPTPKMSHTRPAGENRRRLLEIGVTAVLVLVVVAALPGAYSLFQRYQRMSRVVFSGIGVQLEPVPAEDGSVRVAAVMPYAAPDVKTG